MNSNRKCCVRDRLHEHDRRSAHYDTTRTRAWVLAGTRIPTGAIRRFAEAGYTVNQILREYPSLTREDVAAALAHEEALAQTA